MSGSTVERLVSSSAVNDVEYELDSSPSGNSSHHHMLLEDVAPHADNA